MNPSSRRESDWQGLVSEVSVDRGDTGVRRPQMLSPSIWCERKHLRVTFRHLGDSCPNVCDANALVFNTFKQ